VAGRIRDEDIALVREKSPIDDVIGEHVQLRNAGGGNLKGICPFHDEKSPSLSVSPGRGLFHCLAAETRLLTPDGPRAIGELAGQSVTLMTENGVWVEAPIRDFGVQVLHKITLRRNGRHKVLHATDGHRWFLRRGPGGTKGVERLTSQLKAGDRLAVTFPRSRVRLGIVASPYGIARGITFGDGDRANKGSVANLFTGKDTELLKWFPLSDSYQREDRITITDLPAYFTDELPSLEENPSYLYGWLAGYFAADGCVADDGDSILSSADPANLEYVRNLCSRLGIGTYGIASQERIGIDGKPSLIHDVRLMTSDLSAEFFLLSAHRMRFEANPKAYLRRGWEVESVEETNRVEPVYCAVVEGTHSFVLEDNILTGNCFGCGAGGDVIRFVERIEHLDFSDAVERLANRANIQLRYEEGSTGARQPQGQRSRLIQAHAAAAAFYSEQLRTPEARVAREFLATRGFDEAAADTYGCGFAPDGWDALTKHLLAKGFTAHELTTGGLARPSQRGSLIDRFHRRLLWPIRDLAGDVVGFGARRLFDDDKVEAKYLNTPETPIYKKSQLLYGVDVAKKEIARQHRAVIVEGYTDVMACHLAGVTTAIASCGTAFGAEHVGVIRRLLMDSDAFTGEVIFTFDGDAAGMKAAERAFADDQKFMAQTFVAIEPTGLDPCELRQKSGDEAVRDLVARRIPLVEFVLRNTVGRSDLDTAEGRSSALDRGVPLVAMIKDHSLRDEYARRLAGLVGVEDPMRVVARVRGMIRSGNKPEQRPAASPRTRVDDSVATVEREVLKIALQIPAVAGPEFDALVDEAFLLAEHQQLRKAIEAAGGVATAVSGPAWTASVQAHLPDDQSRSMVNQLSVESLHSGNAEQARYADAMLARLQEILAARQVAVVKSRLQRINPLEQAEEHSRLFGELITLEAHRRVLRERAIGGE
jgi:DNA primase